MQFQRQLDDFEVITLGDGPTMYTEYSGEIDESLLQKAAIALGRSYPLLRARVRQDRDRHFLYVPDGSDLMLESLQGGKRALFRWATGSWNPECSVARLGLFRIDGWGYVAMRLDHSVMDGHSFHFMFRELWHFYTKIANGVEPARLVNPSLPKAHDEILQERFSDWNFDDKAGSVVGKKLKLEDLAVYDVIQRDATFLDVEETRILLSLAHEQRTTVHALLCGAVLVAQCSQSEFSLPVPMTCLTPVDLRTRVDPPIHWTETTNLMVTHQAEIVVSATSDPLVVGKQVGEQLSAAIENKKLSNVILQSVVENDKQHLLTACVSNIGNLGEYDSPVGLVVSSLRGITTKIPYPTYATWTSQGELGLLALFPSGAVSEKIVDRILDRARGNLLRMVTS